MSLDSLSIYDNPYWFVLVLTLFCRISHINYCRNSMCVILAHCSRTSSLYPSSFGYRKVPYRYQVYLFFLALVCCASILLQVCCLPYFRKHIVVETNMFYAGMAYGGDVCVVGYCC